MALCSSLFHFTNIYCALLHTHRVPCAVNAAHMRTYGAATRSFDSLGSAWHATARQYYENFTVL